MFGAGLFSPAVVNWFDAQIYGAGWFDSDFIPDGIQPTPVIISTVPSGIGRGRRPIVLNVNGKDYSVNENELIDLLHKLQVEIEPTTNKKKISKAYKLKNKSSFITIKEVPFDFEIKKIDNGNNEFMEIKFIQALKRYHQDIEDEELLMLF